MNPAMIEVELSDGTILELDPNTSEQAIKNLAARAENMIKNPPKPQGKNDFRVDLGFGKSVDVPVPEALRPVAEGLDYIDTNVMAPLARGAAGVPGMVLDAGKWAYDKAVGNDTNFGQVTQGIQGGLGMKERPADAGFGTDVIEAIGGAAGAGGILRTLGLLGKAGMSAPQTMGSFARAELPAAVTGTLGSYGGESIGEAVGGDTGKTIGGLLGGMAGGIAPAAMSSMAREAVRKTLAKPGGLSGKAYDDLQAMGIDPRPGLVGNKQAATMENSSASMPFIGTRIQNMQGKAFEDYQTSLYNTADSIGQRSVTGQIPAGDDMIGARMRLAANQGETNLKNYFNSAYDDIFEQAPPDTIVHPTNMKAEIARQKDPYTGELFETQDAVKAMWDKEVAPALVPDYQWSTYGVQPEGIPLQRARKVRTAAFYDSQGGGMTGGAIDQVRDGLTQDISHAIQTGQPVRIANPDDAVRRDLGTKLRQTDTEYALAKATDVSTAGAAPVSDNLVVGGDFPALNTVANAATDETAYRMGSDPGRMAVLQRTNQQAYPGIAADTIIQKAQARVPFGDTNISPQNFSAWWDKLSPNEKMIMTNEGFDPRRTIPMSEVATATPPATPIVDDLNRASRVGDLFRQSGMEMNSSRTTPTLTMMATLGGLLTHPGKTLGALGSGAVLSGIGNSRNMARVIAGRDASHADRFTDALVRALGQTAAYQTQEEVR